MTLREYLKQKKREEESDYGVTRSYFEDANNLLERATPTDDTPTYQWVNDNAQYFSDNIAELEKNNERVGNYIESLKGTANYEAASKQFDDYRNALTQTKNYLNEINKLASQYDNEEDYNKAVKDINRYQKYQGKSYDELIDASKNTEDKEESEWLQGYATESITYDEAKAKQDELITRQAQLAAEIEAETEKRKKQPLNFGVGPAGNAGGNPADPNGGLMNDPLIKLQQEYDATKKRLEEEINPLVETKKTQKNNAEYTEKYKGWDYTALKTRIGYANSEEEKKWLEDKAAETATSADYEKEIAELEAENAELETRLDNNDYFADIEESAELQDKMRENEKKIQELRPAVKVKAKEEKAAETEKTVRGNDDFEENSKYVEKEPDYTLRNFSKDNADDVYDAINNRTVNWAPDTWEDDQGVMGRFSHMTDEEKATFNYLYNTGKKDEALEYENSIERKLNERYTKAKNAEEGEYAKEHPVLGSLKSVGTNLLSGGGVFEDIVKRLNNEPIDVNSPAHDMANQTRTIRQTVGDSIDNEAGKFAYDTVMSTVDSAVVIALSYATGGAAGAAYGGSEAAAATIAKRATSTASSIIMGSQVATNTVIDAKERGLTDDQAVTLGILYGAAETIGEKVSIETWMKAPTSVLSTLKKSFIAEGSEEVVTNWLDRAADVLVTGDKNQVNQMYQDYIKQGYSDKEAFTLTAYNLIGEDTKSFIAGGVSGAAMGGAHLAAYGISNKVGEVGTKNAIANINANELTKPENKDTLNSVIDFVKTNAYSGSKEFKLSEKLGQAVENGETISVKDAKKLLKYSDNLDQKKYDTATKGFTNEEKAIVNNAVHKLTHRQSLPEQEYAQIKDNDKIIKAISDYSGIEQDEVVELLDSSKFKDNLKYYKSNGNGLLEIDGKEFRGTVEIEDTDPATGKATLKLTSPDGKDVRLISSDNANFKNDTEAQLYAMAANFKNPNEANAFVENYNGGDFNEYLNEWNLYSNYGSLGFNAKQIYQRINQNVDTPSRKAAYYSGMENFKAFAQIQNINKRAYEAAAQSFKGYQRGTFVSNVSSERQNKMSRAQRNSIRELKMFTFAGLNVELFESKADKHGNYQGENGSFNAKTKTLRIDINAGYSNNEQAIKEAAKAYIRLTVGHELTHAAEQGGGYMKLRSEIIRTLEAAGFDYKNLVDKKLNELKSQDKYKDLGQDELYRLADSEVIADCCETLLNDSKVFEKLFNADKTLAEKFINAVKRAIEKLRQFFNENPTYARTEYGKALQEAMSKVENRVQELWDEAVAQGIRAENKESGSKSEQFSIRTDIDGNLFVDVDTSIYDETDGASVASTIAKIISERFNNIIEANKQIIRINATTNAEWRRSEEATYLKDNEPIIYNDKMKAIGNADEILTVAREWIGEAIKHNKKFVEFARGNVLYKVGDNGYIADVIVGTKADGSTLLYDLVNIHKIEITEASLSRVDNNRPSSEETSAKNNIPQFNPKSNSSSQQKQEFSDSDTQYSIRKEEPPKNTVKGYKVFRVKDGKLYPPMVANPGGADTPIGVWLNADVGERAPDSKTGRVQVKGKGGQSLAFRPGWHLGDIPRAAQFDRKNPNTGVKELFPSDFVWAECDCAADVDYQDEAMSYGYTENGKFRHSYAGLPRVPENGYYKYRTNPRPDTVPWIITGAIKVNRILSDTEVEQILKENGVEAPQRQGGNKTLEELGLSDTQQNSDRVIEENRDLVAVHNLSEDKLIKALKLGGFPMPSIAVTKSDLPHTEYGEISLIFGKDTISPDANRNNKVYSGDAWTPKYPQIDYEVNYKAAQQLYYRANQVASEPIEFFNPTALYPQNIDDSLNRSGGTEGLIDNYSRDYGFKNFYLKEKTGKSVELRQKEERHKFTDGEVEEFDFLYQRIGDVINKVKEMNGRQWVKEYREEYEKALAEYWKTVFPDLSDDDIKYSYEALSNLEVLKRARDAYSYHNNGAETVKLVDDIEGTHKEIDSKIDQKEYEAWLRDLFKDVEGKSGIRNNVDTYTPRGNRRSFSQLHYAETLENVVKAMKKQRNGDTFFAGAGLWGVAAKSYGTFEAMKADSKQIKELSEDEYKDIKEGFGERFEEIANNIIQNSKALSDNPYTNLDYCFENILDAVRNNKTKSGLMRELRDIYGDVITDSVASDILDLIADVGNMPTRYFEAKPQRAVGFDEVMAAVVPSSASDEVKTALQQAGIAIYEYESSNDKSRAEAMQSAIDTEYVDQSGQKYDNLKFQDRFNEYDDLFDMGEDLFEDSSKREILDELIEKYPDDALYIIKHAAEQTIENFLTKTKSVQLDNGAYLYVARKFMQEYNISRAANPEEDSYLAAQIGNIVARTEAGELSQSEIMNEFINTASDALVLSGTLDDTMKNEREFVISLIKGKTLLVTDQQEDHIRENYGDLRRYRTTLGHGYIALESNAKKKSIAGAHGIYIEDIIEEVQEAYPQLIDEDANQITGFGWLEKLLNERLEPTFKSDSYSTPEIDAVNGGYEIMTNLVDQKARQIVRDNKNGQKYAQLGNTARELAQEQRKAVKEAVSKVKEKERQKAKKDVKEAREKAEARYKAKLEKKEQQFKEKLDEQRQKNREIHREKNEVIIAEKEKRVNDLKRLRDNRDRREVIAKINKTAAKMRQMILRPTDTAYVPDEFKNGFIEVTDGITQALKLSDDTKIGQHLNKLSTLLRELATDERTESVFGYEFDENFRKRVEEFADVISNKKIDKNLTLREANDIHNLLKSVVTIVRNANKLINSQERRSISEAGIQIMAEQENLDSKWLNKQLKTIKKYFMTPLRMSEIINAYNDKAVLTKLVNELNRGVRKKNMFFMVANKMFDDYREENVKELDHSSKDVREIRWTDNTGNSRITRMTGMQAMQICMTWNREIADDNLVHISEGGLTIFDPEQLAKGNNKKALQNATKVHGVNNSFITSVASSLTSFEKGYIDIAEQYFNEYSKDAINETSLALKHYKIANSKYYIPIKVDQNSIAKEIEGIKFDSSVENQGMFKTVAPKSRKSIYIQGLDSLINNHIQGVSNYYGLAIPIRNLNKTLNVRNTEYDADGVVVNENTVKDALNKNWGDLAINNYEQMLTDLQNSRASKGEQNSKEINKFIRGFRSNFVTSVLNFNPSVTLKQAASYFTAGAYIDGSILGKGFGHFLAKYGRPGRYKALLDEIDSHTAQHYIRRQGLSSNEIADINDNWLSKAAQNTKVGRKITTSKIAQGIPSGFNPNKWIQNMDCLTTAMLWVATKDQVNRDFNKAKKEIGTDEYWQAVTDLYDKVIEDTQPMYDPLHRPEVLKSSNELVKSIFMFKTQPLQNAGIIYDALGRAVQGNKGAVKQLGKAVASQTASLVTFALMTLAVSMLRHNPKRYRDENDELTAESIFNQVMEDIFTNGMGILFPFGGTEIVTMFTQDGDAVQDNVAVQLNEFIGARRDLYDSVSDYNKAMSMGLDTDPQDILSAFKSFAVVVSQDITGLPVNNAIKNFEGVAGWIEDITDGNGVLESTSEPKNNQVAGRYAKQIESGNTAEAEKILNEYYQKELEKAKADKDIKDPESKAQANTRDMLANKALKTEYQEAFLKNDEKTMQKIVKILYSANKYMKWGKGKSQTPLDKKLEEWRKSAKEDLQDKYDKKYKK